MASPFGLLNIDKPAGATSRDVVNHVQRLVRPAKAGHAGTLDPLATGVLVVCVGPATRLIPYLQQMEKAYRGTFLLGRASETEDIQGEVTLLPDAPQPSPDALDAAATRFVGQIQQRPPAYSALKVKGKRAYDLARSGQPVDLPERTVTVYDLRVERYEYPELVLHIRCGGGTYVRSLGRDLAQQLGTSAVMSKLVRTAIGKFHLADAHSLANIDAGTLDNCLLPASAAVAKLPHITVDAAEVQELAHGRAIPHREVLADREVAAFDRDGRLIAIVASSKPGYLAPVRNFPAEK